MISVLIIGLVALYLMSLRIRKRLEIELSRKDSQMEVSKQYHERRAIIRERILNQSIDNAIKRNRSVYYVPRLNEIIEYKELEELGEL